MKSSTRQNFVVHSGHPVCMKATASLLGCLVVARCEHGTTVSKLRVMMPRVLLTTIVDRWKDERICLSPSRCSLEQEGKTT